MKTPAIRRPTRALAWTASLLLAAATAACSSSPHTEGDGGHAMDGGMRTDGGMHLDGGIGCTTDPRVDPVAAGFTKAGLGGTLRFEVVSLTPATPIHGDNTWVMRVLDTMGRAQSGVTLTAVPFMPDHGHGTSVSPQSTASGDGYSVGPLRFSMPGVWRVTFTATVGAVSDSAAIFVCVQG